MTATPTAPTTAELDAALAAVLDDPARAWLDARVAEVAEDPTTIRWRFPEVGRRTARGPLDPGADPGDPFAWTVDDAARARLLVALGDRVGDEAADLYRHGDAAERRAVLRALPLLPLDGGGLPLVEDGLRTNDLRLVAAALGPYAAAHLDDHAFAHAVLKAVFVGLPLDGVAGLPERTTPALSRMLAEFVHERVAAGRTVPADVWPLIDRHPPEDVLAAITAETEHPVEERRDAARAALASRPDHR